jgi:hypothetical protein
MSPYFFSSHTQCHPSSQPTPGTVADTTKAKDACKISTRVEEMDTLVIEGISTVAIPRDVEHTEPQNLERENDGNSKLASMFFESKSVFNWMDVNEGIRALREWTLRKRSKTNWYTDSENINFTCHLTIPKG